MAPYLPQNGGAGGGSPYSEGGALYALGLIHANHGVGIKQFLLESLRNTNNEVCSSLGHWKNMGILHLWAKYVRCGCRSYSMVLVWD